MRITQIDFFGFRSLKTGQVKLPEHGVLLGSNNVGKTAIVEAIALVFGRERITAQLSDWDFFGGLPKPDTRFTIVCSVAGFSTNVPGDHPAWFVGESAAEPVWWHDDTKTVTFETDCPIGGELAAQVALCGRYDDEECEFETKRYFYHGPSDPFTDGCDTISLRRVEELGVFVIPSNRQWDRLMSFGSSSFLKALRQSGAVPGEHIENLKLELRDSKAPVEEDKEFKELLTSAEDELRRFLMVKNDSALVYRVTSLDTYGVLQNLLVHVRDTHGTLLPLSRQGAGMVSLQSFLVVLAIANKRRKAGKNFILVAEEPELHLHPSLHKRLANRIRAVSTQSLVTTHSPLVAATYKPTECILLHNTDGNLRADPLRTGPIKDIGANAIRKLYLQKREAFYEAILGSSVLVPEGEFDYEWLRLLQRVVECADDCQAICSPLNIVPTQDSAVLETYLEVVRFGLDVLPFVDGDRQGNEYLAKLCALSTPPKQVVQLGEGAAIEFLAAYVLEPALANAGSALKQLLPVASDRNLKGLQRALAHETNKKDRDLHESLTFQALDTPQCINRAIEFFLDIAAIQNHEPPKNAGWKESQGNGGVRVHTASHIRKA